MSAAEPDWLTAMRETIAIDRADVRRLLAAHDQLRGDADRMADALELAGNHVHQPCRATAVSPAVICSWCHIAWPCPGSQAADALRTYRNHRAGG